MANLFDRDVHCLLGLPFDRISMPDAVQQVREAAALRARCFVSTANLNFLVGCRLDPQFRNSVINSDPSVVDGMPLVWIARFLRIPLLERVAGSDLFEKLREKAAPRLRVYFFGGMEGVAERACHILNTESSGLGCVGFESPGFGSIENMSSEATIEKINASGADFLVVSLGAKKGQAWIEHNRARISVPVISHLGAVVNFVAGTVLRAPRWMQQSGLEWLWRIKEEPGLWRRYAADGWALLRLVVTRVIPYAWFMYRHKAQGYDLGTASIAMSEVEDEIIISLRGAWTHDNLQQLRQCFSSAAQTAKDIRLELEQASYADSSFIGLLLLLYGDRTRQGKKLSIASVSQSMHRIFYYSCTEFLIDIPATLTQPGIKTTHPESQHRRHEFTTPT